ncbi:MAG TPA: hypothetical protein VFH54_10870 [Mycobacteriales bacterium]|nr:hypothetical protein [Mycobacteriales bacterium]
MSIRIENSLNLGAMRDRVREVSPEALNDAAQHVLEVAREKAPLLVDLKRANDQRRADPGALRASGYARVVDDTTAEVGFSEFYAGWQHERTDYHHQVGQAKYLEEPLVTEKDEAMRIMARRIGDAL